MEEHMKQAINTRNIDEYIAGFPSDIQEILKKIRMTIRKAAQKRKKR